MKHGINELLVINNDRKSSRIKNKYEANLSADSNAFD